MLLSLSLQIKSETIVKVLLEKIIPSEQTCWHFSSTKKFNVCPSKSTEPARKKIVTNVKVEICNHKIYVDGKPYKHTSLKIEPTNAPIAINGNAYDGSFIISQRNSSTLLINLVEIEDYICSVLKTESWPGWPKEVNKAFAIASRRGQQTFGVSVRSILCCMRNYPDWSMPIVNLAHNFRKDGVVAIDLAGDETYAYAIVFVNVR